MKYSSVDMKFIQKLRNSVNCFFSFSGLNFARVAWIKIFLQKLKDIKKKKKMAEMSEKSYVHVDGFIAEDINKMR